MLGTFYSEYNCRKMRAITALWRKSMNAQGQVMVSLLSCRLIAVKIRPWICLPGNHRGTSFAQTNLKTASEYILMAHACRAHTGQIDGMLWLRITLLMYCQGFSQVAQFTSWEICVRR